jgi:chemotaxis signal transduction protein
MIVLHGVGNPIGILVDSVRGIVPVAAERLMDLPADGTFQGCASATFELDGDLIHLLSANTLLGENEIRLLAEYSAMSEARGLQFAALSEGREQN